MRLIDADKIVEVAVHAWGEWNLAMATQDTNRGVNKVFKMQELCKTVKAVAEDCPTIDLESLRPHAAWINIHDGNFICSCCKNPVGIVDMMNHPLMIGYLFCPYCGAKMDGGENDDAQ